MEGIEKTVDELMELFCDPYPPMVVHGGKEYIDLDRRTELFNEYARYRDEGYTPEYIQWNLMKEPDCSKLEVEYEYRG